MPSVHKVSKKRIILSLYIDFLLFSAFWGLLEFVILTNYDTDAPEWLEYFVFAAFRAMVERYVDSFGYRILGIDKVSRRVNGDVYERESWLTMLLGTLFILEGTKQLVRWTQISVPQPFFGVIPSDPVQIAVHVFYGIAFIMAGYWYFKLNVKGLYLGLALGITQIISDILSWNLWDSVAEQMVIARRALLDLPVREGEVAWMQALFPEATVTMALAAMIAMLLTFKSFRKRSVT